MRREEKIFVAGHHGLIGSALIRRLKAQGYQNIVSHTVAELDLMNTSEVEHFYAEERPEYVFVAAGKTGGVYANNTYRADFMYENLVIQNNLIHHAFVAEVRKLAFFSCSCIYPKFCPQPMKEEYLLSSALEPTNEPFAIAKIAGMKLCESYCRQYGADFITLIPTNIYGVNQNYTPLNSLIIPALISRFHEGKMRGDAEVVVWGTGRPQRDFLFADDLADAAIFLMNHYSEAEPINVGSGKDIPVREAAEVIARAVGFKGSIAYDTLKPEGVLVKLQDISKISAMGWTPKVTFEEGIRIVYKDYVKHFASRDHAR